MSWLDSIKQFDFFVFQQVNGLAGKREWLDALGIFASQYLIAVMGVFALWTVLRRTVRGREIASLPSARKWFFPSGMPKSAAPPAVLSAQGRYDAGTLFSAFLASAAGYVLRVLIGDYLGRVRPFSRSVAVTHLGSNLIDASFPSGHATVAFALAFSIAFAYPAAGMALILLAALVAFGRIFVGVHYPGDVAGGMLLGFVCALLSRLLVQAVSRASRLKFKKAD